MAKELCIEQSLPSQGGASPGGTVVRVPQLLKHQRLSKSVCQVLGLGYIVLRWTEELPVT